MNNHPERPEELSGATYKIKTPLSEHAIYITINDIVIDDKQVPFEIFINSKNMEQYAWIASMTRLMSAVFRNCQDASFVIDEMKSIFDPKGGYWQKGTYMQSIQAEIGHVIEKHFKRIGLIQ